ncbi:substrate-binding domain-containing protein [Paenibacillus sp. LMG 31456]|uniref:Substrate-binding domain-containing protein n=1 Tax=Paenibacillus foliorum TaxID=2654974 RepID=A0A972K3W5_9BACL|nr:substrate-binding domain-containing protein [Paenibacillus foliorum]NOU96338.1 substrate-binding domain-containing protein [Paenibacillus foliorum]
MKRKPAYQWLTLVIVLSLMGTLLAGCAGGGKNEQASTAPKDGNKSKKAYKIALSNSFTGNSWRSEMLKVFEAYAQQKKDKGEISEFFASSSGNDPQAQINEIRNMMSKGYDAILVDASSPTALAPVLGEAVDRGIVVVAFDNTVDSNKIYNVNTDQVEFGRVQAKWLMEQMGGKGNILMIKGIEGITIDRDRDKGHREVLAKYPNVKILQEGFGNYDDATTSVIINNMLSAHKATGIQGILTQGGGENAIVEALKQHKLDPASIPLTGEMLNGLFRHVKESKVKAIAAGQPPYLSAAALDVALKVLKGEKTEKTTIIPLPFDDYKNVDKWYAPGQPDNFYVDWTDPANSYNLKIEQILQK